MYFDLHTHHERCNHAQGTIRDYIEEAIRKGLAVIGISDHTPYFGHSIKDNPYAKVTMAVAEFPAYVAEVLALKDAYRDRIKVLLGVEADYLPKDLEDYREALGAHPLDYCLGSVHFVQRASIFHRSKWREKTLPALRETVDEYFGLIDLAVASGLFQVISHLDALKTFCPEFKKAAWPRLEATLKGLAASGVAMEVNTSGQEKECAEIYPAPDILERAQHYGVKVTFGSDAHDPSRVGEGFYVVSDLLRAIGYRHWVYFEGRKPVNVPLGI